MFEYEGGEDVTQAPGAGRLTKATGEVSVEKFRPGYLQAHSAAFRSRTVTELRFFLVRAGVTSARSDLASSSFK